MKNENLNHYSLNESENVEKNKKEEKPKLPGIFYFFRAVGIILATVGVILLVSGLSMNVPGFGEDGWFDASSRQGEIIFGGVGCIMFAVPLFLVSFYPKLAKIGIQTGKYILHDNKKDLEDLGATAGGISARTTKRVLDENEEEISHIVNKGAEMLGSGVRKIKSELNEKKIFCKHCGASIDADSTFCNRCGKQIK